MKRVLFNRGALMPIILSSSFNSEDRVNLEPDQSARYGSDGLNTEGRLSCEALWRI